MPLVVSNNVRKIIASAVSAVATTITLVDVVGLPTLLAGEYTTVTLVRVVGLEYEIVKVTDITGNILTVERAQEGTTAITFSVSDEARNFFTAGMFDEIRNATHTGEVTGDIALTLQSASILNKTLVTVAGEDYILVSDTSDGGTLKRVLASDMAQGGMQQDTYDPTAVAGDVFDMDNMVEGTTTKILTDAERTVIGNQSGANTGDQVTIVGISGTKSQFNTAVSDGTILYVGDVTSNVTTNLSTTQTATTVDVLSSDGADATLPQAISGGNAGVMSGADKTLVDGAEQASNKNVNNGYAPLDSSALVPLANLPASVKTGSGYKGAYNATTNTPTIIDATGSNGDYYRVSVAGSQDYGSGSITFDAGDLVLYNGTTLIWEKVDGNPDLVTSVAGKQGVVTLVSADITDFDTEVANNSAVVLNTAKTSNASHTGDMTGDTVLTAHPTMISNKPLILADPTDFVLASDSDNADALSRVSLADLIGGGVGVADSVRVTCKVNEAGGITAGQIVYISGANGGFPQVSIASNDNFAIADPLAVSNETKTNGQQVIVTIQGLIENINTAGFTPGSVLYLGTAGALTEAHPTGIDAVQRVGHTVKANGSTGSILVELDSLTTINDHNGTMRVQIVNQNAGDSASVGHTWVNDAGHRASINLLGSGWVGQGEHFGQYNQGYGKSTYTIDGNWDFEWYTDATDAHAFAATLKMKLTAEGELQTQSQCVKHTALLADDHAVEINCDAAGLGDVKAVDIVYTTGAIATGQDEAVMLVNIDESAATGGDIVALEVLATEGSANIYGMLCGVNVNPLEHLSGSFEDMDSALVNATDRLTEFTTAGSDIEMFSADNDTITIGNASKFEEIEFLLATPSNQNINPVIEYSTGVGTWAAFTPVDGTNGMRNTGVMAWLDSDIPSWVVGLASEFLIRITRTRNNINTPPIESKIQIASGIEYSWNKDAELFIQSLTATGNISVQGQVSSTVPADHVPTGTTQTIDWDDGNAQIVDLGSATGDVTLTLSNPLKGASYLVQFIQGATFRDVITPSTVQMAGGVAGAKTLDITAVDNAVDTLTLFFDGTNYQAALAQAFA